MYYLIAYRKKTVFTNLRNSFPSKSENEIKHIAKKFYFRFADYIVETLKGLTMSREEMQRRVSIKNPELLEPYIAEKQSVICLVSHQFNWEWAILANSISLSLQVDGVYKKLSNGKLNNLILAARSRFGAHLIEKDKSIRDVVKRRNILRLIAIVADQLPLLYSPSEKYWATFLHQDTAFYVGGERIAKLIKAPVFFASIHSPKRGYYEIEFKQIGMPPYKKEGHQILENYIQATEALIREEPEGWLWSHKRWKYTKAEDDAWRVL